MTTPLNLEMLKELRATLEALTAERTLDEQDNRRSAIREAATGDVIRAIRAFCNPLVQLTPCNQNISADGENPLD